MGYFHRAPMGALAHEDPHAEAGTTPPIMPPRPNYNTGVVPPPTSPPATPSAPSPYVPTAPASSSKLFGIVDKKIALLGGAAVVAYLFFKR